MSNKTTTTANRITVTNSAKALASQIAELVINKGTCFAGFDYNGKRRNVALGTNLSKHVKGSTSGKGNWGTSHARASIIEYNGKLYLQGVENSFDSDNAHIKRYDLSKATNVVVG